MVRHGRRRGYTWSRGAAEALLGRLYESRWPSRLPFARTAVERVEHRLRASLPPGVPELRVGFASDLHAGPTTPPEVLTEAFQLLRAFDPHLLLLGGDYVLFDASYAEALIPLVRSVPAPLGRFAVLGNHDIWADDQAITRTLEDAWVSVLVNRLVRLPQIPEVSVGGLDDAWAGVPRYDEVFAARAAVHLVLMHGPDHAPRLRDRRFDFAVCGHTHGGQVSLPRGRPLVMPTAESWNYPAGRFELPGGPLFVSRGVGHAELPLRLFAPPDVLLFRLVAAD